MRSSVYVRNFESTLRLLAARGHQVHVVAAPHPVIDPGHLIGRIAAECPGVTHSPALERPPHGWSLLGVTLRRALDYLRYLGPEYREAPKLRRRAEQGAPPFAVTALRWPVLGTAAGRGLIGRVLRWADRALQCDPSMTAFLRAEQPDLVLVTPLVEPGSPQADCLRSARELGIRTGLCVYSWDNLTNKGLIHDPLDVVTVWNEAMKHEAVTLHGVPPDRVKVTGAPAYDHWFTWTPRLPREAFCARVGLDPGRPYILYLCSSRFIAPDEVPFVRRWVHEVRRLSPRLRDAGVLVRPHPQNLDAWQSADVVDLEHVAVWPRAGGNPVDADSRADYYDSIVHSAAVVGVNTSAQIESAIVGRGVYTVLAPEFTETQEGTLHFRHLRDATRGLLHVASDFPEHVAQLEAGLGDTRGAAEASRRFVEAFVRPHGIDEAAAPQLVAALEATAAQGRAAPSRDPWWAPLLRLLLARPARALENTVRTTQRLRVARIARRQQADERTERRLEKRRRVAVASEQVPQEFELYLRVRDQVQAIRESIPSSDAVTPAEQRVLAPLEALWDATPEMIGNLRSYGEAMTGVDATHYRNGKVPVKARDGRDLRRLLERSGEALWVEEPAALGGFGFNGSDKLSSAHNRNAKLYNADSLRFFKMLSLLQDAALLKELQGSASRPTVWEIGGGWGGFAYQVKTVCPGVTYLITGPPSQLLLSAVYLMTVKPGAGFRLYDPEQPDLFFQHWTAVDFAFAPEHVVAAMRPPSLDLVFDVMTLERMSRARIRGHVQRAYDLGARYVFSVCPTGSPDPGVAMPVLPALERLYWPHPVSAPTFLARDLGVRSRKDSIDRTFFLGWRRLRP